MLATSRSLLALSAIILAAGAAVHAQAYAKASVVADHSALPAIFVGTIKGLWLSQSVSSLILALALAGIAARPQLTAKPLIMLIGFGALCIAAVLFATMGNCAPAYVMLVSGASALTGALLQSEARVNSRVGVSTIQTSEKRETSLSPH